jgi:hypothetical protein
MLFVVVCQEGRNQPLEWLGKLRPTDGINTEEKIFCKLYLFSFIGKQKKTTKDFVFIINLGYLRQSFL